MKSKTNPKSSSSINEVFVQVFNAALDAKGAPAINFGRNNWVKDRYGVSVTGARKWLVGETMPDWEHLVMIADDLGFSLDSLLGRKPGSDPYKAISIPLRSTDSAISNSRGGEQIFGAVGIGAGILHTTMRMKHNGVELYVIASDDMSPDINSGDIAFVDTKVKKMEDGKIYMLTSGTHIVVRRARVTPTGRTTLVASNPIYPPHKVKQEDIKFGSGAQGVKTLKMKGEILWKISKVDMVDSKGKKV